MYVFSKNVVRVPVLLKVEFNKIYLLFFYIMYMYILITHVPGYMCVYDTDTGTTGTQILLSIVFSFPHSFALRHTRTQWQ